MLLLENLFRLASFITISCKLGMHVRGEVFKHSAGLPCPDGHILFNSLDSILV